jgi:hypothetical protein
LLKTGTFCPIYFLNFLPVGNWFLGSPFLASRGRAANRDVAQGPHSGLAALPPRRGLCGAAWMFKVSISNAGKGISD